MKIVVIGATGTIGKAVVLALAQQHDVIQASRSSNQYPIDITAPHSIQQLFESIAPIDAVVSTTGQARFNALDKLTDDDFQFSLANKLMGQVNLVRLGTAYMNDNGSFTLTSGVLSHEPIPGSAAISLVNAGLEGFARAAALELPRGIRVNVVSPPWVTETLEARGMDLPGGMSAANVAHAYVQSVTGQQTGTVMDARSLAM
jgi:NAD(P)-dependent dehydrogenase (short-subunit alcohol dehydrogenase family)